MYRFPLLKTFYLLLSFLTVSLNASPLRVTGYLPSYRLDSSDRAVSSNVMDLTSYRSDFGTSRTDGLHNIEKQNYNIPSSYIQSDIDKWYGLTLSDIIYFSIRPTSLGELDLSQIKERDLSRLANINHIYGTKISIAITGDSSLFVPMISNKIIRKRFLHNLMEFCNKNKISGVDYDWEFPRKKKELSLFTTLIDDSITLFHKADIQVSAAVSRFRPLEKEVYDKLDRINLMAYDFYGRHSTYESSIEAASYLELRYSLDPEKINLGIPFYGRIFSGSDPSYWSKAMYYSKIMETFTPKEDSDEAGGYFYNGPSTVRKKTKWAKKVGLGGVMIWEVGQDTLDSNSLLAAIKEVNDEKNTSN